MPAGVAFLVDVAFVLVFAAVGRATHEEVNPVLGVLARLSPQKGLTYLVAAMPSILEQHPDTYALVVGEGYLRPDLEWVDLLSGSEGTLGIITEAELQLLPEPAGML